MFLYIISKKKTYLKLPPNWNQVQRNKPQVQDGYGAVCEHRVWSPWPEAVEAVEAGDLEIAASEPSSNPVRNLRSWLL